MGLQLGPNGSPLPDIGRPKAMAELREFAHGRDRALRASAASERLAQ